MAERKLDVIVATDCGSTTTKAIMIERKSDGYRQTFRGEAPTTVEDPGHSDGLHTCQASEVLS